MLMHEKTCVIPIIKQLSIGLQLKRVLIDFSFTVKAATLIFISERGSAISSAMEGNQVLFIIW